MANENDPTIDIPAVAFRIHIGLMDYIEGEQAVVDAALESGVTVALLRRRDDLLRFSLDERVKGTERWVNALTDNSKNTSS